MTKPISGDEPVYPTPAQSFDMPKGIPIRLHLAAMAMQGLVSSITIARADHIGLIAETAIQYADALLAEYNKGQKDE